MGCFFYALILFLCYVMLYLYYIRKKKNPDMWVDCSLFYAVSFVLWVITFLELLPGEFQLFSIFMYDQNTTYVIILCNHWTSLICSNFLQIWKIKSNVFFSFRTLWTQIHKCPIWNLTIFKLRWIFLWVEECGIFVKLVEPEVICQHMFHSTYLISLII